MRILIVGYGSIGKRHLRIIRKTVPDADLRVLRHRYRECKDDAEYASNFFYKLKDALEFRPDVAVLANPAPFHIIFAKSLAENGCQLLIEKPLSEGHEGVQEVLDIAKNNGVIIQVGYNLRFLPSLMCFRDLVREKYVGRTLSVRCEVGQYLPSWRPNMDYRHSVSARAELGGGALLELSHELDYLRWIFGEIHWVNAWMGKLSDLEIDVEDTIHLTLAHTGDGHSNFPITSLSMDFIRHDTTRTCMAIAECGTLRWQGAIGKVDLMRPGGSVWETIFQQDLERDESYLAQWNHFLGCVKDRKEPLVTGNDGLAILSLVSAIRESAKKDGVRVKLSN